MDAFILHRVSLAAAQVKKLLLLAVADKLQLYNPSLRSGDGLFEHCFELSEHPVYRCTVEKISVVFDNTGESSAAFHQRPGHIQPGGSGLYVTRTEGELRCFGKNVRSSLQDELHLK